MTSAGKVNTISINIFSPLRSAPNRPAGQVRKPLPYSSKPPSFNPLISKAITIYRVQVIDFKKNPEKRDFCGPRYGIPAGARRKTI